jgi:ribonuclease G
MANELVINTTSHETRVALIENGTISELYIERTKVKGIVGNIYKGRVVRVLPGMQAAFVDIGLEKAAFLYVADVYDPLEEFESFMERNGNGDEPVDGEAPDMQPLHPIEELLQEGQELLVQISKEPIGTKGARITSRSPGGSRTKLSANGSRRSLTGSNLSAAASLSERFRKGKARKTSRQT